MMHDVHELYFEPFRIDLQDEQLWQGTQVLRLRPKSFAVLRRCRAGWMYAGSAGQRLE